MPRRLAIAILALVILVLGSGAAGLAFADEVTVLVGHNRLDPAELRVQPGTIVVFHNQDAMPGGHSIVADDGSFESPGLAKDEKWSRTFAEPGTYSYAIREHPSATGKIIVE